jgi:hypothetical protein
MGTSGPTSTPSLATARLLSLYLQTPLTFGSWDAAPTGPLERFPSSAVQPVRREPELDPESEDLVENEPFPELEEELGGPHPPPRRGGPRPGVAGPDAR